MSHTSVSGTENSLLSQTCSAQKSPVSGVSTTTADLLCQWLVEARRRSSVSRFRHACGVLQYHHQTFLNSEVSWEKTAYQPFRHACPLSGNVLILVVQVGFVSSPFVKLDRMLSFFRNRIMKLESLDSDKRKQILISLPRRWKLRRHWLVAGLLQHLQFWISYADPRDVHVPHSLPCSDAVAEWLSLSEQSINWSDKKASAMATLYCRTLLLSLKYYSVHAIWYADQPEHDLKR